jgi:superfamily II DNA or RNA helicase
VDARHPVAKVRVVHSAPTSDDRELALRELEQGEIDAVCSVDVFNEGIDVPSVDRVVRAPTHGRTRRSAPTWT